MLMNAFLFEASEEAWQRFEHLIYSDRRQWDLFCVYNMLTDRTALNMAMVNNRSNNRTEDLITPDWTIQDFTGINVSFVARDN